MILNSCFCVHDEYDVYDVYDVHDVYDVYDVFRTEFLPGFR